MSSWQALVDPGSGSTYYFNPDTNETSWDPPADYVAAAPAEAPAAATGHSWVTAVDESSGNTYYYNTVTQETRWDPPPELAAASASAASSPAPAAASSGPDSPRGERRGSGSFTAIMAQSKQAAKKQLTVADKLKMRSQKFARDRKKELNIVSTSTTQVLPRSPLATGAAVAADDVTVDAGDAGGDEGALPGSWQALVDPGSGQTYYFNPDTNETTWSFPTA